MPISYKVTLVNPNQNSRGTFTVQAWTPESAADQATARFSSMGFTKVESCIPAAV